MEEIQFQAYEIMGLNKKVKTVAIIQSRLTSTRFPAKVMKDLAGKPVLQHVLNRLSNCESIDRTIVATTYEEADDALETWCIENSIDCFRGEKDDVLKRFYECSKKIFSRYYC